MASAPMAGKYPKSDKNHPGWRWEIYADPSSSTGYVRKIYDPTDSSSGGKPTEYYSNYDYGADQEDAQAADQASQSQAATKAAKDARASAVADATQKSQAAALQNQADRSMHEFDVTSGLTKSGQENQLAIANVSRDTQLKMATDRLREDARQHDLDQAEKQREFNLTNQNSQGQLGLDILKEAGSERGALNFVQGDMIAQGVKSGGLSPFVAALRSGQPVQFGGATETGESPTPLTPTTLADQLTGTNTTAPTGVAGAAPTTTGVANMLKSGASTDAYGRPLLTPQVQQAVDAGRSVFEGGLASKPLGFLENMSSDQKDALTSIGDYIGVPTKAEYQYYNRSRPNQGNAAAA